MENASKALLIAAAIIIAIILIALGVYVVNQGRQAVGNVNMSEQEIDQFNSKWEMYKGGQLGSNARTLIKAINNYNIACSDGRLIRLVLVKQDNLPTDGTVEAGTTAFKSKVNNTKVTENLVGAGDSCFVKVKLTKGGLIAEINIYDSDLNATTNNDV